MDEPGRVATLVPCETAKTSGVAFRISEVAQAERALDHLMVREQQLGGYEVVVIDFVRADNTQQLTAIAYIAKPENDYFVAGEDIEETASIISRANGTAGANKDYLYRLVEWERDNDGTDDYLTKLSDLTSSVENK